MSIWQEVFFDFLIFNTCIHTKRKPVHNQKQAQKNREDTESTTAVALHLLPRVHPAREASTVGDDERNHRQEHSPRKRKNSLLESVDESQYPPAPTSWISRRRRSIDRGHTPSSCRPGPGASATPPQKRWPDHQPANHKTPQQLPPHPSTPALHLQEPPPLASTAGRGSPEETGHQSKHTKTAEQIHTSPCHHGQPEMLEPNLLPHTSSPAQICRRRRQQLHDDRAGGTGPQNQQPKTPLPQPPAGDGASTDSRSPEHQKAPAPQRRTKGRRCRGEEPARPPSTPAAPPPPKHGRLDT